MAHASIVRLQVSERGRPWVLLCFSPYAHNGARSPPASSRWSSRSAITARTMPAIDHMKITAQSDKSQMSRAVGSSGIGLLVFILRVPEGVEGYIADVGSALSANQSRGTPTSLSLVALLVAGRGC